MRKPPIDILREGCTILDPILHAHGFEFQMGGASPSSGGLFAFGAYVNAGRKLELHYRYSLGLVTYHFGAHSLDHVSYMRAVPGPEGKNHYPGFSEEPLAPFEGLKYDLEHFASAFLLGDADEFARCVKAAKKIEQHSGIRRSSLIQTHE
jgi:hypothetical protein